MFTRQCLHKFVAQLVCVSVFSSFASAEVKVKPDLVVMKPKPVASSQGDEPGTDGGKDLSGKISFPPLPVPTTIEATMNVRVEFTEADLTSPPQIAGYQGEITTADPNVVIGLPIPGEPFYSLGNFISSSTGQSAEMSDSFPGGSVTGQNGVLVSIPLEFSGQVLGTYQFLFTSFQLFDDNGFDIADQVLDAEITFALIPEPSSLALALTLLCFVGRRK